ncbi:MAG TPA: sulfatase, partial [Prosthecobacter sp.]|nr:sulfatase [Prosthecobacter sp.]
GERGRMDERMDLVRSVTDGHYVYLRNYYPHVSQAQRVAYQFETPTTRVWNDLFVAGKTNDAQSIFWRVPKAVEELYDLQNDPDEVQNLAGSAEHKPILEKLRQAQREHILKVRDVCFLPEHEMHTRAEGTTPYAVARDHANYPLDRILAAAELASGLDAAAAPELAKLIADTDSAVRFWGALGLLMRGESVVRQHADVLQKVLADDSVDVRIAAAQALGQYGGAAEAEKALITLKQLAAPTAGDVLTAMSALAAIEALGAKAASLHAEIGGLDPSGPSPDGRYNSYVPRLIENIVPGVKPAGKGKARAKRKKK